MSTTTTDASHDATEARFLAPETHQKTAGQSQEQDGDEQAGDLRFIPLDKLVPSPLKVRKTGGANIDELAMLIDSQGLLQNLICIPHLTKRKAATDRFEVVAGGRRLHALRRLAELGRIDTSEEILCKLTTRDKAIAMSTAENSGREDQRIRAAGCMGQWHHGLGFTRTSTALISPHPSRRNRPLFGTDC